MNLETKGSLPERHLAGAKELLPSLRTVGPSQGQGQMIDSSQIERLGSGDREPKQGRTRGAAGQSSASQAENEARLEEVSVGTNQSLPASSVKGKVSQPRSPLSL